MLDYFQIEAVVFNLCLLYLSWFSLKNQTFEQAEIPTDWLSPTFVN